MKHTMYAVYDRLSELYGPLNEFTNDKVAKRSFLEACKNVDGFKQHPTDLEIHRIGTFDDETGSFKNDKEIIEKGE